MPDHCDHAKNSDENPDEHCKRRTHLLPPILLFPIVPNKKADDDDAEPEAPLREFTPEELEALSTFTKMSVEDLKKDPHELGVMWECYEAEQENERVKLPTIHLKQRETKEEAVTVNITVRMSMCL